MEEEILKKYDTTLEDNVYVKIWSSLPRNQKVTCYAIAFLKNNEIKELIEMTGFSNSMIQMYKKRMFLVGIIDCYERGKIDFWLLRFDEFVKFQKTLED